MNISVLCFHTFQFNSRELQYLKQRQAFLFISQQMPQAVIADTITIAINYYFSICIL